MPWVTATTAWRDPAPRCHGVRGAGGDEGHSRHWQAERSRQFPRDAGEGRILLFLQDAGPAGPGHGLVRKEERGDVHNPGEGQERQGSREPVVEEVGSDEPADSRGDEGESCHQRCGSRQGHGLREDTACRCRYPLTFVIHSPEESNVCQALRRSNLVL